ncbi:MAG: hypothetical protein DRJ07_08225 [Bacteroidetes bacterium]|nr:MAG: hypothetical protein DRJ07_08225 [Bacteroidota bacterium]
MTNHIIKFITTFLLSLLVVFAIHIFYLKTQNLPLFDNKIIAAYIINFLAAVVIYVSLFLLKNKFKEQLGFLYMGGSFIKFILFFIFFYPAYKLDGQMSSLEFGAFFIPYLISLIFETLGVIKILKK